MRTTLIVQAQWKDSVWTLNQWLIPKELLGNCRSNL